MKAGDTLYCKKDYFFELKKLNTKNVSYKLVDIKTRFNDDKYPAYIVSCDDRSGAPCIFYKEEIDQYFMSLKELRKNKLFKIEYLK